MAELLLLPSDGAIVEPLLLPSVAGAIAAGGAEEAGGGVLSALLQAESTSAAARAPRASFVFIDESPELYGKEAMRICGAQNQFVGRIRLPSREFYRESALF
jgi:hypothetical protein